LVQDLQLSFLSCYKRMTKSIWWRLHQHFMLANGPIPN
jgi:hypothetical protein